MGRTGFSLVLGVFFGRGSVTAVRHTASAPEMSTPFHRNSMLTIIDRVADPSCRSFLQISDIKLKHSLERWMDLIAHRCSFFAPTALEALYLVL